MSYQVYKYEHDQPQDKHTEIVEAAIRMARVETGHRDWTLRACDWYVDVLDADGEPAVVSYVWLQRVTDSQEDNDE